MGQLSILKWYDHLIVLQEQGKKILGALQNIKASLPGDSNIPVIGGGSDLLVKTQDYGYAINGAPIVIDSIQRETINKFKTLQDPKIVDIIKGFLKKFPEVPAISKQAKSDVFSESAKVIHQELGNAYYLLVNTASYAESTLQTLLLVNNLLSLSYDTNPQIANAFMDLVVTFMSIHYMVYSFGNDKKLLTLAFSKAEQVLGNTTQSPHWTLLTTFLINCDKPLPYLQQACTQIAPRVFQILNELKPTIKNHLCNPTNNFRKLAVFSLTPEMSGISAPDADIVQLKFLRKQSDIFSYFIYGFLICPVELSQQTAAIDILKEALNYGYVLPVYRNELFNVQVEYERLSKDAKGIASIKGIVNDAIQSQATHLFHKERRDYLRHQLKQMLCVLGDLNLMTTKLSIIISAIGFARDEVVWYFNHTEFDIVTKKRKRDSKGLDVSVLELIWLVNELSDSLIQNKDSINIYFEQFIQQVKAPASLTIIDAIGSAVGSGDEVINNIIREIRNTVEKSLQQYNINHMASNGDFDALRVNWSRLQIYLNLPNSPTISNAAEAIAAIDDFVDTVLWYNNLDSRISEIESLKVLAFYQGLLHDHLKISMTEYPEYLRFTGAYGHLAERFVDNVSDLWPSEYSLLSGSALAFSTEVYSVLGQLGSHLAHEICLTTVNQVNQTTPAEAHLLQKGLNTNDRKILKKLGSNAGAPGWESNFAGNVPSTRKLESSKHVFQSLIFGLSHPTSITIGKSEIRPFRFFSDSFFQGFKTYLLGTATKTPEPSNPGGFPIANSVDETLSFDVKRPSIFLNELRGYLVAIRFIENLVPIACFRPLKTILLTEIDYNTTKSLTEGFSEQYYSNALQTKKVHREKGKSAAPQNVPLIAIYLIWYTELIISKAAAGNVIYSFAHDTFVSKTTNQQPFQVEAFTSGAELKALCELFGVKGITYIDEKISKVIYNYIITIKELVSNNIPLLSVIQKEWTDDAKILDSIKKFKNLKDIQSKLISLGFLIKFRENLTEAAGRVFKEYCPTANRTFEISSTVLSNKIKLDSDITEAWVSVNNDSQDALVTSPTSIDPSSHRFAEVDSILGNGEILRQALHPISSTRANDATLWSLFPIQFAVILYYIALDDQTAIYNPAIDALENNTCLIGTAYASIIEGAYATSGKFAIDGAHKETLQSFSVIVLRIFQQRALDNAPIAFGTTLPNNIQLGSGLESSLVVLRRYITDSKVNLPWNVTEQLVPNSLFQRSLPSLAIRRQLLSERGGGAVSAHEDDIAV